MPELLAGESLLGRAHDLVDKPAQVLVLFLVKYQISLVVSDSLDAAEEKVSHKDTADVSVVGVDLDLEEGLQRAHTQQTHALVKAFEEQVQDRLDDVELKREVLVLGSLLGPVYERRLEEGLVVDLGLLGKKLIHFHFHLAGFGEVSQGFGLID